MDRKQFAACVVGLCVLTVGSAVAATPNIAPKFVGTPYEVTVDVSPPGLESFSFTGSATDSADETLAYFEPNLPYGFTFASTVGNPAYFTLGASDLDYRFIGTYGIGIGVYDNNQFSASTGIGVIVRIIPEPTTVLLTIASMVGHRTRQQSVRRV